MRNLKNEKEQVFSDSLPSPGGLFPPPGDEPGDRLPRGYCRDDLVNDEVDRMVKRADAEYNTAGLSGIMAF